MSKLVADESGVLKQTKSRDIGKYSHRQCNAAEKAPSPTTAYPQAKQIVDEHTSDHEEYIDRLSPSIEYQGEDDEHNVAPPERRSSRQGLCRAVEARSDAITHDQRRQKDKKEKQIGKNHLTMRYT